LEMALQVVQNAWQNSDEEYAQVEVPTQLQHLTRDQWEEVCYLLSFLQWQMEQMPIH
jgi:triacylglycerol esterase/lipase EstA (alpha/beta hydrolase family)